ncbi:phosphogluconate dehydrogenase (NAD(+)-dependent, decarboxylating) [Inmirania thermothiophila]|uniref:6-phosphogluconate dehydrogenase n=1 Tax=Inmirania thermothiophila TaxID=1750597 RepID=A0A3N1Y2W4_9GAMM|nr:decarboxylating 6-phosphogluconate dehydrogenase [Inmirania thermothiophila]ROR32871.1 6-phosphogluconate dehydrogenase [Inmirania thermothiophila]
MRIAIAGLGRMGGNMARRLRRAGIGVVGWNRTRAVTDALAAECGVEPAASLAEAVRRLRAPRVLWLMLPAGGATEQAFGEALGLLEAGDVLVDGANSDYRDSQRRAQEAAARDIRFVDCGTSGGIWGLEAGYCLMLGGEAEAVQILRPVLDALAPPKGWAHVGPAGAGHYVKMIHNGIEYGMMQALAEGLALLRAKETFGIDLAQVAELWRHGSVVRSWLLDLTAEALARDPDLRGVAPWVEDSGEGRWTVREAVDLAVPAPVITLSLMARFQSRDEDGFAARALAAMRNAFGGHRIRAAEAPR